MHDAWVRQHNPLILILFWAVEPFSPTHCASPLGTLAGRTRSDHSEPLFRCPQTQPASIILSHRVPILLPCRYRTWTFASLGLVLACAAPRSSAPLPTYLPRGVPHSASSPLFPRLLDSRRDPTGSGMLAPNPRTNHSTPLNLDPSSRSEIKENFDRPPLATNAWRSRPVISPSLPSLPSVRKTLQLDPSATQAHSATTVPRPCCRLAVSASLERRFMQPLRRSTF